MGILIAAVVTIAGVIGAGMKEKTFSNDSTHQDTVAFEKRALEERLARVELKKREVVELGSNTAELQLAREADRFDKIKKRITQMEKLEKEKGWN